MLLSKSSSSSSCHNFFSLRMKFSFYIVSFEASSSNEPEKYNKVNVFWQFIEVWGRKKEDNELYPLKLDLNTNFLCGVICQGKMMMPRDRKVLGSSFNLVGIYFKTLSSTFKFTGTFSRLRLLAFLLFFLGKIGTQYFLSIQQKAFYLISSNSTFDVNCLLIFNSQRNLLTENVQLKSYYILVFIWLRRQANFV